MKKIFLILIIVFGLFGCNDDEFLSRAPKNVILADVLWSDPSLVESVLFDLYDRIPVNKQLAFGDHTPYAELRQAFVSDPAFYGEFRNTTFPFSRWSLWSYNIIREVNLFIRNSAVAEDLSEQFRKRVTAEARFIRAKVYFELVRRMGGVPLILEPLEYDFGGDPSYLRNPRLKEHEIYDWIISEMDDIKSDLPTNIGIKSRATRGAAIALQSRAAVYAGSIAKYGVNTPAITLPNGEVGIPAAMATGYFEKSLSASQELIDANLYSLYMKSFSADPAANFAELFTDKLDNPEIIFVRDYLGGTPKTTGWTIRNQPYGTSEEVEGGRMNPSLNLAQAFEKLDNTPSELQTKDEDGNYIYYDNIKDIFADRDARLGGTIMLPGTSFKGLDVDILAGYYIKETNSFVSGDTYGARSILPGDETTTQVVGYDGPVDGLEYTAQTGFYIRKFQNPEPGSGTRGYRDGGWNVYMRFGEVILNAAEAAFELGNIGLAATYLNMLRSRAGFTIPLTDDDISFDRIANERLVELAFENHRLHDLKRWRIAHIIYDGVSRDLTTNPGVAIDNSWTRPWALWPYKVHDPNGDDHGKYIFEKVMLSNVTNAVNFRFGNYYSRIPDAVISNNPLIIQNPNQD